MTSHTITPHTSPDVIEVRHNRCETNAVRVDQIQPQMWILTLDGNPDVNVTTYRRVVWVEDQGSVVEVTTAEGNTYRMHKHYGSDAYVATLVAYETDTIVEYEICNGTPDGRSRVSEVTTDLAYAIERGSEPNKFYRVKGLT